MKFQRLKTNTALQYLEINKQASGRKYWENILTSNHEKTVIAQDLPFVKEVSLKEENFKLKERLEQKVSTLANNNEERAFIIYATLFAVLLHKFTNTTLVSFGIPNIDCRGEYSSDTLIMKTKLDVNTSVRDLLNTIKDQWLTSREYESFPLEVYEENDKLFDAFFSYTRKENNSLRDCNFNFLLCRTNDQTSGKVIYNSKAYSKKKIASIIKYFEHFIEVLLNDLDQKISNIEVILPEEKELLFNVLNDSYIPLDHEKLFLDFFKEVVEKHPNSVASGDESSEISYIELDKSSNKVAHFLLDKGIQKGDKVVIIDDRSTRFLITLLGILKSGGVFIALDVDEPIQRAITIIQDTGAHFLFANNEMLSQKSFLKELFNTTTIQQIINTTDLKTSSELAVAKNIFSSDIIEDYQSTPVDVKIEADDICYLIYSSGTTGKPKGIKLHHLGMINHFIGLADVLKMSQKDSLAQTALCSFDIFVVQTLLPLIRGGKVLFVTKDTLLQPVDFFETLIKEKVTIIELVPSLIKTLLSELTPEIANQMNALRHLISCGEQLTTELTSAWFSYFPEVPIANAYGPAEASDDVTAHVVNSVDTAMKIVPIGKPLDNVCMYTLDEFGQLAPLGVPGELCISGIAVGKGYLNEPEKTKKVFIPNTFINDIKIRQQDHKILYKTGDLGVWHSEGYITFKGRKDFMVKIRGVRIELAEVEIALAKHQAIQDVFVTDYNHHGEKVLCAYYQTTISVTKKELNAFLKERLPSAMIPSFFVELENVPYTKNGKIDRKKLPSPIQKEDVTAIDINDKLENELLNIWAKILQIDSTEIGKESDFFYLGGHSLLAVRLVASIKKVFNVDIALDEIFTYSIFEELAAQIRTGERQKELIIPKVHKKEFYQVSPPQRRFYIHNQIYPNDLSYNSPQYYKVKGRLDLKKVRAAFLELITTHEILRTSFQLEENLPVQIIHDKVPFELGYSKDEEKNIQSHIDTFVQPFNLGVAPLFRVSIVECKSEEFYLLFDLHHIISDEISDSIIVSDFLKAYAGKPLLKPEISYKDYAEWFNARLLKGEYIKHEEYWLDQFHTIPSKLSLPYDIQETIDQEKFGKDITYTIKGDEILAIKTLLRENKATAFMFFLAVFNIQLKRLSFNEDIAVGSPVSGRDDQSLNNVVGLFLNLIVLRNKVSEDKSFTSFLEQVKHNSINALKYQTYPFDLLTAKLGIQGETNETPLYNVMFAHLMKNEGMALAEGNVEIKAMDIAHNTAKADIQLTIYEGDSDFDIFLTVNTNLFSEKTATALLENYKSVLKLCIENPEISISEIPLPVEFDFMKKTTNLDRYKLTF